jgi:6-pyruvoyltetrahydropterin/6-carboxytetrahydropterin synthase
MVRVTRNYRFSASHRLHVPQFSDEENRRLFGKCNNPHGHGHNYLISITVQGPVDSATGLAVDPAALDRLMQSEVLAVYDHSYINCDVPEMRGGIASTENIAYSIQDRLQRAWSRAFPSGRPALAHIRVQETKRNVIELPIIGRNV